MVRISFDLQKLFKGFLVIGRIVFFFYYIFLTEKLKRIDFI